MKKILLALIALISSMSINAQIMKVMKGDKIIATYNAREADRFVYEEEPPFGEGTAPATYNGNSIDVKWVQLWENGPKFAEVNVGVTDGKAENAGGYYAWVNSDIATANWGTNWRMPKKSEFEALIANCDIEHTTQNGVKGIKVTGKGEYSNNSIFMPAAGYSVDENKYYVNEDGHYWSSDSNGKEAWELSFYSGIQGVYSGFSYMGYSVRAVLNDGEPDDAPTGFGRGSTKATIDGNNVNIPWTQLWDNGPKFANYNIGVTDGKAESFGEYCEPYGYWNDEYDTATKKWGGNWRMPTIEEFRALIANCESEWTTINGVPGRKYTGKGNYSDNSIFLPAAGYAEDGDMMIFDVKTNGAYWSSTLDEKEHSYAYYLDFYPEKQDTETPIYKDRWLMPIRAVVNE